MRKFSVSSLLIFLMLFVVLNSLAQNNRIWATYYGGTGEESGYSIVTDTAENVLLAGYTYSTTNISLGGFQNSPGGSTDAFLVKFDAAGNRIWATYYGGSGIDIAYSVATDISGNIYLAGSTTSTTNIASGGGQAIYSGNGDAFLVKFDALGNRLWSTYVGGPGIDVGYSVAVDPTGNVVLAGITSSATGIAMGGFQTILGGGNDAFVMKFDGAGNRLWASYYGDTESDGGNGVAIDKSGNIYLGGYTNSLVNIASLGFQKVAAGGTEAFLVKFNGAGNRLWATYYGGTEYDTGYNVATDTLGNVFLAGYTISNTNIASGGFQNTYDNNGDGFLVKFNSAGARLWGTYYGGSMKEELSWGGLAVDIAGNAYLVGDSYSSNGIASGGFQNNLVGEENQFLVKFAPDGDRRCATYYGQSHEENSAVAVDDKGNVYLSGSTPAAAGIASGGFQNSYGGGMGDTYLVKFGSIVTTTTTGIQCKGACTGIATATPIGCGPYSYSWSTVPLQTGQTATGLCAGIYTVTVTDAPAKITTTVVITESVAPNIILLPTDASCGMNNGTATVSVAGGVTNYTYSWNNGQTTQTAQGLGAGIYTVTVTDENGCSQTQTVTLLTTPSFSLSTTGVNATCGLGNGTATASPSGVGTNYTYSWDNGQTTQTAQDLSSGVYTVIVTDENGCTQTKSVAISDNPAFSFSVLTVDASCDVNNGTATVSVINGTGSNYIYSWNDGQTTQMAQDLGVGSYIVTVSDNNGCTQSKSVVISAIPSFSVAVIPQDASCEENNGSAVVTVTGVNTDFIYSWSDNQTTSTATGLAAGIYIATIQDGNGCTKTRSVTIGAIPSFSLSTNVTGASCNVNDGSAGITISGGSGGFNYSWSDGQTNQVASNLGVGTYTVTVSDGNGCVKTETVVIPAQTGFSLLVHTTNASCGKNDGTATATITGGSSPFSYSWNDGQSSTLATGLIQGIYTITVSDGKGCIQNQTVTVASLGTFAVLPVTLDASCGLSNGTASVTTGGGTTPYVYFWSDGQTEAMATGLNAGTYSVTVKDANNCSGDTVVNISTTPAVVAMISSPITIRLGESSFITASGGDVYSWNPSGGLSCVNCPSPVVNPTHTTVYCATVRDQNNCSDTACVKVSVDRGCEEVYLPTAFSPNGDGQNDVLIVRGTCIEKLSLQIFDRWGEKVFESNDQNNGWDGRYKSLLLNTGIFSYHLDITRTNGEKIQKKGNISLVR